MNGSERMKILVVDDEPQNIVIASNVLATDYQILAARDGQTALDIVARESVSLVILDVMMPEMDGHEVCRRLKEQPQSAGIPVIFATALDSEEEVLKGLELGAFFYLVKPISPQKLKAVVASALENRADFEKLRHETEHLLAALNKIQELKLNFRTVDEARELAMLVSKMLPQPDRALTGLAEIMINAVEHGNLAISYDEKGLLNEAGQWAEEVERRLSLPEYAERLVTLTLDRQADQIFISVVDEGAGFDWQGFMEMDPSRAFDNHGRGIAMANMMSFDEMSYQGKGNHVVMTIKV